MALNSSTVSVGATATYPLITADANHYTSTYYICNAGAATLFVGGTPVAATGYPIFAGGSMSLSLSPGDALYGFVSSATADVRILGVTKAR